MVYQSETRMEHVQNSNFAEEAAATSGAGADKETSKFEHLFARYNRFGLTEI